MDEVEFNEPDLVANATGDDGGLPEQCDAAEYRIHIGQNIATVTVPTGPMLRAYGDTDIVTQDYLPQRTNIVYDSAGIIRRVSCG